jgi:hypothetical protein
MTTIKEALRYWWRAGGRALKEAFGVLDTTWKKIVFGVLLPLLAIGLYAYFHKNVNPDDLSSKIESIVFTIGSLVVVLVVAFFVAIFFVPPTLESEAAAAAKTSMDEILDRQNEILRRLSDQQQQHEQERSSLRAVNESLNNKINDTPAALADIKGLFHASAAKGRKLSPTTFADCQPWIALAKEVAFTCLGEHSCHTFEMPVNVEQSPNRAKQQLDQFVTWMNEAGNRLSAQNIRSACTQSWVANMDAKIKAL